MLSSSKRYSSRITVLDRIRRARSGIREFLSRANLQSNREDVKNTAKYRDTRHNQVNNAAAARRGAEVSEPSSIAPRGSCG